MCLLKFDPCFLENVNAWKEALLLTSSELNCGLQENCPTHLLNWARPQSCSTIVAAGQALLPSFLQVTTPCNSSLSLTAISYCSWVSFGRLLSLSQPPFP